MARNAGFDSELERAIQRASQACSVFMSNGGIEAHELEQLKFVARYRLHDRLTREQVIEIVTRLLGPDL